MLAAPAQPKNRPISSRPLSLRHSLRSRQITGARTTATSV
jgi:hypothetical protein